MKLNFFLLATAVVVFSGCFSRSVIHRAKPNFRQAAYFFPSAVYENSEDGIIAIEGMKSWNAAPDDGELVFVLLPRSDYDQYVFGRVHRSTRFLIQHSEKTDPSPVVHEKLPVGFSLAEDNLDLTFDPGSVASISRLRPSGLADLTILPATLILDAVTLPVQLYIGTQIGSMGH